MGVWAPPPVEIKATKFTRGTVGTGALDICTATGGDIFISSLSIKTGVVSAGLTSLTVQTNTTTALELLATTLLAALTADKNLVVTNFGAGVLLESGKKLTVTIVGTGTGAGTLLVTPVWLPLAAGATLA